MHERGLLLEVSRVGGYVTHASVHAYPEVVAWR